MLLFNLQVDIPLNLLCMHFRSQKRNILCLEVSGLRVACQALVANRQCVGCFLEVAESSNVQRVELGFNGLAGTHNCLQLLVYGKPISSAGVNLSQRFAWFEEGSVKLRGTLELGARLRITLPLKEQDA